MKKALFLVGLMGLGSSLGAGVTAVSGTITDWPAGKKGEVQLRVAEYATDSKNVVVAKAPVDEHGNFALTLPDAAALSKSLSDKDISYSYGGDCKGSVMLNPAAQLGVFELMGYVDGELNSTVKFRTTRYPTPDSGDYVMQLVYASAKTASDGGANCDLSNNAYYNSVSGNMRIEWAAHLDAGWNLLTATMKGTDKMLLTDEAMPKTAFWHIYEGFGGVGMKPRVTADGKGIEVEVVNAGGAAEAAGIKVGDLLLAIDDAPVVNTNVFALASKVRGPEGTIVTLTVKRGGETLKIPIKRQFVRTN